MIEYDEIGKMEVLILNKGLELINFKKQIEINKLNFTETLDNKQKEFSTIEKRNIVAEAQPIIKADMEKLHLKEYELAILKIELGCLIRQHELSLK